MKNIEEFEKTIKCIISDDTDIYNQYSNCITLFINKEQLTTINDICKKNNKYLLVEYDYTNNKGEQYEI